LLFDKSKIFDEYKPTLQSGHKTVVTWAAIIHAHNIHGQAQEALHLFYEMQQAGVTPNDHIYSSILSIIDLSSLHEGHNIHTINGNTNIQSSTVNTIWQKKYGDLVCVPVAIVNSLISMYAKCGDLQRAKEVSYMFHFCCSLYQIDNSIYICRIQIYVATWRWCYLDSNNSSTQHKWTSTRGFTIIS
jgi:pentatricopeptide repeat protein